MSEAEGSGPYKMIDPVTRLTDADVKLFEEQIAPRLCGFFAHIKGDGFIGHSDRSEFPDCTQFVSGAARFADTPLYQSWSEDHKTAMAKRMRLGNVDAGNFLMKHLVMTFERGGTNAIVAAAMERGAEINQKERMDQIRHQFLISTAQRVADIKKELGIFKPFTNARGRLENIESEMRGKDIRPAEVFENPKKAIADNTAALQKINGGLPIPLYEIKPL